MKIKVITTFLLFCLIAGICYYISLPDYHVRNSMSFSNQGTRDTELTVIVYKYWGIDETIRKIETEHNKINGTPTDDILQDLTQENVVFQKEYTRQVYDTKSIITNGSPLKDSSVTYLKIKKGRDCTG